MVIYKVNITNQLELIKTYGFPEYSGNLSFKLDNDFKKYNIKILYKFIYNPNMSIKPIWFSDLLYVKGFYFYNDDFFNIQVNLIIECSEETMFYMKLKYDFDITEYKEENEKTL